MIVWLASFFSDSLSWLRLFQYITFRGLMAAMTALFIPLVLGPWTIKKLRCLKMRQELEVMAHRHTCLNQVPLLWVVL